MPLIDKISVYLETRQGLIKGRECFFQALRIFLRPEQRIDAAQLEPRNPQTQARIISDDEWVANPSRGYLTLLPNPAKKRLFKLCVLQLGTTLRVGIKVPSPHLPPEVPWHLNQRLEGVFPATRPTVHHLTDLDEVFFDWEFDAQHIYTDVQAFEDAVAKVALAFEAALHSLTPTA